MAVADALFADDLLDVFRQPRGETAAAQVEVGVEQRESAFFTGEVTGCAVGGIAHDFRNLRRHLPCFRRVVAQAQHDQRITEAGETETDAAFVGGFLLLLFQRPGSDVEHVVEHAGGDGNDAAEVFEIEPGAFSERLFDKFRQVDRTQAAAAVRRQRLLGAVVYIQAISVKSVNFRHGDVEYRSNTVCLNGFHGSDKALGIECALIGTQGLLQAITFVDVGKTDTRCKSRQIGAADDQFVQWLCRIFPAAAFAIGQHPRAAKPAIAINARCDAQTRQHALRTFEYRHADLSETH